MPDDADRAAKEALRRAVGAEPGITSLVRAATENAGGELVGLATRLKTDTSTTRKLRAIMSAKGVSAVAAAASIGDLIRYRVVFPEADYAAGVTDVAAALERGGVVVDATIDMWADSRYKGLNVTWVQNGQAFEVQFHTRASAAMAVDSQVRRLYEAARSASTNRERAQLQREMKALWKNVRRPPGTWTIG
jgi:hypothetical protein